MSTTIGCPIPGASQPKEPVRLIDANSILRLIDTNGSAYDGIEYQAYKAGTEYVRSLIDDAPTIDPESLRPTAHWIHKNVYCIAGVDSCSNCGCGIIDGGRLHKYCQNCGARMVNEDE
jgi:hypothetical protein